MQQFKSGHGLTAGKKKKKRISKTALKKKQAAKNRLVKAERALKLEKQVKRIMDGIRALQKKQRNEG